MNYEEWILSTEFGLRRRYKINHIVFNNEGMRIDFSNNFHYQINEVNLKYLWKNDCFNQLCNDIENEFLKQIMNGIDC